jgi:hypothetical protein
VSANSAEGSCKPLWGTGWIRRWFRNALLRLARQAASTDEGRELLAQALEGVPAPRTCPLDATDLQLASPYPDLGTDTRSETTIDGRGAIFITGRFRSGSTLLWNIFRSMNGFTAYYEPHNERRWFDPKTRGERVDPTHRGVSDYWAEYEGLSELAAYYREEWTWRNFFMDEQCWDPDLLAYTRLLLARAKGRPVLQCNRIDFRLAWHRRYFPRATIIHLYRHPRDQWCSALGDLKRFPTDGRVADFEKVDGFYLLRWCRDLKHHFPFLEEKAAAHPYQLFYFLWKLSYLFGRRHAHHSLSMEELIEHSEAELLELFERCDIDPATQNLQQLKGLIVRPDLGKWKKYAGDTWFRRHEETCEEVLSDFFTANRQQRPDVVAPDAHSLQCVP